MVYPETILSLISDFFAKYCKRNFKSWNLQTIKPRWMGFLQDDSLYVAIIDATWRDDTDLNGGCFIIHATVDPQTMKSKIFRVKCMETKSCEDLYIDEIVSIREESQLQPLVCMC